MIRRVQNIYYMLAYAFQVLHENGYRDVAAEEFENGLELLSAILCRGVSSAVWAVNTSRGKRRFLPQEEKLKLTTLSRRWLSERNSLCAPTMNFPLMPTPTGSLRQQFQCYFAQICPRPEKRNCANC